MRGTTARPPLRSAWPPEARRRGPARRRVPAGACTVLGARVALQERLEQVADDRDGGEQHDERDPRRDRERRHVEAEPGVTRVTRQCPCIDRDRDPCAIHTFPRFAGADLRRELVLAERPAGEVRRRVGDPHDRHRREHEPRRARLHLHERHPGREQHDETDGHHHDRALRGPSTHDPCGCNHDPQERREAAQREHDRRRPAARELRGRCIEQRDADHHDRCQEDVARRRGQSDEASPLDARERDDCERDAAPRKRRQQEQRRQDGGDQHRRRQDACCEHVRACSRPQALCADCTCSLVRPKRRSRWRYDSMAASNAAASKSGQRRSVK